MLTVPHVMDLPLQIGVSFGRLIHLIFTANTPQLYYKKTAGPLQQKRAGGLSTCPLTWPVLAGGYVQAPEITARLDAADDLRYIPSAISVEKPDFLTSNTG